jgi:glycine cleavage system regulatory protein
MAQLAGQFAGILRVEVPDARVPALVEALRRLDALGLRLVVEAAPARPAPPERPRRMELDVVGLDRPGIVREIARALVEHGVNIDELVTDRTSAAMSGELLFRSRARLAVPARTDAAQLRARLEKVAADLVVQVSLAEPDPDRR